MIKVYTHLLLCVCVRVAAAVFSSSVMFCSVSSDTLHFSITTISISVHRDTQFVLTYISVHKCGPLLGQYLSFTTTSWTFNTRTVRKQLWAPVTKDYECLTYEPDVIPSLPLWFGKRLNALKQQRRVRCPFY